ncbi:MAG: hypothetical protein ACK42K_13195, partial [Leptonema sp. (in: bacteria)]
MASKKDKLTQKIQEEVKKNISTDKEVEFSDVVKEIQTNQRQENFLESDQKIHDTQYSIKNKENMTKKRDSIYNVSADLRLEDYVEDNQRKDYTPILKNILIFL